MRSSRAFKKSSINSTFSARVNAHTSFHQSLSTLIRSLRQEAPPFDMDAISENVTVAHSTDNFNVEEYDTTEEIDERENQYIEQSLLCMSTFILL